MSKDRDKRFIKGTRPRAVVYAKGDEQAKWKGKSVNYPATATRVYANAEFYDLHYYLDDDSDVKLAAKFVSAPYAPSQ